MTKRKNNKTQLDKALDNAQREELKTRLHNAILLKKQMRMIPTKKIVSEQMESIKTMMKHPKMNQQILQLYGYAIAYNPKTKLPTPVEIFDNPNHFKAEYYQYILSVMKTMKDKNISLKNLDKVLDNPYGNYMSRCIGCPLNPFAKKYNSIVDPEVKPKNDTKDGPKDGPKDEPKNDIKDKPKDEPKYDIKDGPKSDIKDGPNSDIKDEIIAEPKDEEENNKIVTEITSNIKESA